MQVREIARRCDLSQRTSSERRAGRERKLDDQGQGILDRSSFEVLARHRAGKQEPDFSRRFECKPCTRPALRGCATQEL
jgi:hypothetical protein